MSAGGKRVVIYTRVSRDDTGEGRSNDRQEEACRRLCEMRGWTIVGVRRDVSISGYSGAKRPGWEEVVELIEAREVDLVVAWAIDRITRNMIELERVIQLADEHDIGIATVSGDIDLTSDVGRMVARIIAAVARAEVERKAARQRLANEQRAKEGLPYTSGVAPFGYTQDHMHVVPAEAEAIRRAAKLVLDGVSLVQIAKEWNDAGLYSRRPSQKNKIGPWRSRGVRGVLSNPLYIGKREYNGQVYDNGQWPKILDEATHLALLAKFADPSRKVGTLHMGRTPLNLLTGIATCTRCEDKNTVRASASRGEPRYVCTTHNHLSVPRQACDSYVRGWVVNYIAMPGVLEKLIGSGDGEEEKGLQEEMRALRSRLDMLEDGLARGTIDLGAYGRVAARVQGELDGLEARLARTSRGALLSGFTGLRNEESVGVHWNELPLAQRRALLSQLCTVSIAGPGVARKGTVYDPGKFVQIAELA